MSLDMKAFQESIERIVNQQIEDEIRWQVITQRILGRVHTKPEDANSFDADVDDEFKHCMALVDVLEYQYNASDTSCDQGFDIIALLKKSLAIRAKITRRVYEFTDNYKLQQSIVEAHKALDALAKTYGGTL